MVTIPLPPSAHHKNKQTKAQWRMQVEPILAGLHRPAALTLGLTITLYGPWFDKPKHLDPKMADWDRLATPIQDETAKALRFNDRCVFRCVVEKRQSERMYATVEIYGV